MWLVVFKRRGEKQTTNAQLQQQNTGNFFTAICSKNSSTVNTFHLTS